MKKEHNKKPQENRGKATLSLQIGRIAKKTGFEFDFVKQVYNDMTGGKDNEFVTMEVLEKQIAWCKSEGIIDFETYVNKIKAVVDEVQKNAAVKVPTNEQEMNELRKKLGYNNKEWKKVKVVERQMGENLKKLILEFMAGTLATNDGKMFEKPLESELFKELNDRWRNFARNYAIREYPRANTNKEMRGRITGLFEKKLMVALTPEQPEEEVKESVNDSNTGTEV